MKYKPSLLVNPATQAYTTFKGVSVQGLRNYGNRGIFASTMVRTRQHNGEQGYGGYFGVQWLGTKKKDKMLFSIWDKKQEGKVKRAIPNHENCKLNCHDCGKKVEKDVPETTPGLCP